MREPASRARISKIVAAIDKSDHSKLVMEKAFVLAIAFNSNVYVVSAIKLPRLPAEEGDISMLEISQEEKTLSDHQRILIDKFFTGSDVLVESTVLHGDPAAKITEFAERVGADLIVIGSRGYSGFKRALLGSVSEAISHRAHCSGLIVKKE